MYVQFDFPEKRKNDDEKPENVTFEPLVQSSPSTFACRDIAPRTAPVFYIPSFHEVFQNGKMIGQCWIYETIN
jgi:hypothetical protein